MAREKITRKWEVFQGRNRFYCDGRLMTAPYSGVFLLTVFLITGTSTLFFIFDCKYLAENVTIAIPIVGGLLFMFTMSSLLRTSLTDPGIIPRATVEEAAYVEQQIEVTNSANSPTYRPPPRTKEVLVKGQTIKLKYCFTCKIFRPPRASHCSLCDNCVDRFDHHCPWVGNCVGRRNYRFFYMFIVSLAFLAVFIFACAIAHLILITKDDRQFLDAMRESPASVIVAVICFFSVWSILGLAGFHTYLTTSNQTTNEDIKGSFTGKRGQESFNPYSQGNVCLNCFYILCGPVTPSLIDRRGLLTDNYRTEVNNKPIISEPLKHYGQLSPQQQQQITMNSNDVAGIYRQTIETTGMYSPIIKKHLYHRAQQIMPSKNCANNQKVLPSSNNQHFYYDLYKNNSMPQLMKINEQFNRTMTLDRINDYNYYGVQTATQFNSLQRQHNFIQKTCPPVVIPPTPMPPPFSTDYSFRQFTPPEKRYSSTFGRRTNDYEKKQRPRSSCIYENFNLNENGVCAQPILLNQNPVKSERNLHYLENVKVRNYPVPEYSQMYIQDHFD